MDGNTLQQIRLVLLDRRRQIGGGGLEKERDYAADMSGAEIIDIAQTLEQIDRDSSLKEQERREFVAIERALVKLASGGFGVCEDCEEEIPSKRLMVVPEARLCARCQAFEERERNRHARGMRGAVA